MVEYKPLTIRSEYPQKMVFNLNWCITFPVNIPNMWYRFWWRVLLGVKIEKYDETQSGLRVE